MPRTKKAGSRKTGAKRRGRPPAAKPARGRGRPPGSTAKARVAALSAEVKQLREALRELERTLARERHAADARVGQVERKYAAKEKALAAFGAQWEARYDARMRGKPRRGRPPTL